MKRPGLVATAVMLLAGCSGPAASDAATRTDPASPERLVPPAPRMRVVLMSSLPLVHGDSVDMKALIAGRSDPHPLHRELQASHDLVVADVLDRDSLARADLLILVQPRGLPPEALVAIDAYVREGGKLLLLADPVLEWSAGKGVGDPLGPQRASLISPLLKHWGIELIDPEIESVRLPDTGTTLVHPGRFAALPGKTGDAACAIARLGHVARCQVGRGQAVLVADADLIDPAIISNSAESGRANRRFFASLISDLVAKDTS